ncbi:DUF389 domain-containing protein [Maridesulfovibrio zosterae]|uniref:DUF389 domain-containing protein n=1 Tax=Maridesulfovibrio zosterae TaxID=82171 RepID=UPI00068519E3|nr:DUF389 domain-containing protein [Maridesulfovibrio zosterae]
MPLIFKRKARPPLLFVSDVRREFLLTEITRTSAPSGMYYLLMVVACFIASIGLMADSPAVVIGAMLVSPLMTPIFGFSLGLVRGEFPLIRDSLFSVVAGILLGIGGAFLIGCFPVFFEITNEIAARTEPNLLDLGVAAFAGIAGTVALIDERVSPVMPGIAIATSLVPPLCASGLCLALQQYSNAWGSFLLFFANFLVILSIASVLFIITGFIPNSDNEPLPRLIKHFATTTIGLIIVAALLTQSLIEVSVSRKIDNELRIVTLEAVTSTPNTTIEEIKHETSDGIINGFIMLQGPASLKANVVKIMEEKAEKALKMPIQLIVRTSITQSISASANANISSLVNAHAKNQKIQLDPSAMILEQAELLLRSYISKYPWYTLMGINYMELKNGPGIIVELSGPDLPQPEDVERIESLLRNQTRNKKVSLIVRFFKSNDITRHGRNLFGAQYSGKNTPETLKIETVTTEYLDNIRNVFPIYVEAQHSKTGWKILADIAGSRLIDSKEVENIEQKLAKEFKSPVKLYVYSKSEALVDSEGVQPFEFFSGKDRKDLFRVD